MPRILSLSTVASGAPLCGLSSGAYAAGNAAAGKSKAAVCGARHGPDGNSMNPDWPKLAGQHAVYLKRQLMDFKSGARNNALMKPRAAGLSDQDMEDLAACYASQTPK